MLYPDTVRPLTQNDIPDVLELYTGNPEYFAYCPPPPSEATVRADMLALPPAKEMRDKHFIGFYAKDRLAAVMDLIDRYPDDETALIGLLMVNRNWQGKGVGAYIVQRISEALRAQGFRRIRIGVIKTNLRARSFWRKQGFCAIGNALLDENASVIIAEKQL